MIVATLCLKTSISFLMLSGSVADGKLLTITRYHLSFLIDLYEIPSY